MTTDPEAPMVRFSDVFAQLVRLEIELWNELDDHLSTTAGLTLAQFQALAAIRGRGDAARVQDLSGDMSITVGAASKVVDRLERDGLAVRSAHPFDRRSSLVGLTQRGAAAIATADQAAEEHLRTVLSPTLSEERVASLHSELVALRADARTQVTK